MIKISFFRHFSIVVVVEVLFVLTRKKSRIPKRIFKMELMKRCLQELRILLQVYVVMRLRIFSVKI